MKKIIIFYYLNNYLLYREQVYKSYVPLNE